MISPPRMAKPSIRDAVAGHFAGVAEAVDIEIVVQDFPPISGFTMEPALLARIAREIPRARTIKLEDPPTPFKTTRILEASKDIPVRIFGGLGGVFLLEELSGRRYGGYDRLQPIPRSWWRLSAHFVRAMWIALRTCSTALCR